MIKLSTECIDFRFMPFFKLGHNNVEIKIDDLEGEGGGGGIYRHVSIASCLYEALRCKTLCTYEL